MSSSDGTGSVRNTVARKIAARKAAARKPALRKSAVARPEIPASAPGIDKGGLADPWFTPGPKAEYSDASLADIGGYTVQGEWFLPTGRAGLRPDSMTESWDDNASVQ